MLQKKLVVKNIEYKLFYFDYLTSHLIEYEFIFENLFKFDTCISGFYVHHQSQ